jgi:hypothetical protein
VQIDTIYIERNIEPIHIYAKGKFKYFKLQYPVDTCFYYGVGEIDSNIKSINFDDTSFVVLPQNMIIPEFVSQLDTILKGDTIKIQYEFPKNFFAFSLEPQKDSIMFKQIIIKQEKEK